MRRRTARMRDNNADMATAGSFLVPCAEARAVRRPRIRSWPPASPVRPPGTGLRPRARRAGPAARRQPGCPRRAAAGTGSVRRPWNTSLLGLGRPRALGISPPLASRITWLLFDIAEQRFTQHKPGGRLRQGAARRLLRAPAASCAPSCALPLRRTPADRPRRRDHARAACAARRRPGPGRPKGRRRALGAPQQWQRKRRSRGGGQRRGQRAAGRSCHNLTDVRRC